ncbi:hypothetical protein KIN20_026170 [Parelaphostrongylus tenuis]|uniref:Uncharacterized protein n=1 Tax=Parelaphostrongylus tenuis TaxID=148309 RepID=A0AAD5NBB4_PARTN|nr:hypothetical protein KIN20_026170 [Parelaphostrongylus tenuis]
MDCEDVAMGSVEEMPGTSCPDGYNAENPSIADVCCSEDEFGLNRPSTSDLAPNEIGFCYVDEALQSPKYNCIPKGSAEPKGTVLLMSLKGRNGPV